MATGPPAYILPRYIRSVNSVRLRFLEGMAMLREFRYIMF